MPSLLSTAGIIGIGIASAVLSLLASNAPFMMATQPASGSQLWADGPMKLVETPIYAARESQESPASKGYIFVSGASHMALLHNSIFRGFNSLYRQAPHVRDADKADFVGYALTWFKFVKSHHDDEELNLFTKIEHLLEDTTVFEDTHKEHESFMPGLGEFHTYLSTLPTPQALNGTTLLAIMDSFHPPFETHFHNEITTILSLRNHPNAPAGDSPASTAASDMFRAWGKKTVSKAGTTDVVPFFLLNTDLSDHFEEGLWSNWPPMPAPVKWGLVNVAGCVHGGYWKFASCDARGMPRELYALETKKEA